MNNSHVNQNEKQNTNKSKLYAITAINADLLKNPIKLNKNVFEEKINCRNLYAVFSKDNSFQFAETNCSVRYEQDYYFLENIFTKQNLFERYCYIGTLPWEKMKNFEVSGIESVAIAASKFIPPYLVNSSGNIKRKNLIQVQNQISKYLIEHPDTIEFFFEKESNKKGKKKAKFKAK